MRAEILHPDVPHARLLHERGLGRRDELVRARLDHRQRSARLRDWLAVVEALDGQAAGAQVVAGRAADGVQGGADQLARAVAQDVCEVVDAVEGRAVRGRRDGDDLVEQRRDVLELGHVQALKAALGVSDQVDLVGAGLAVYFLDERRDLGRRLADGTQAADKWEARVGAVGEREGAVALRLKEGREKVQVFIVGGAEAVEQDDGVGMGGAAAGEVIVGESSRAADDGREGKKGRENRGQPHGEGGESQYGIPVHQGEDEGNVFIYMADVFPLHSALSQKDPQERACLIYHARGWSPRLIKSYIAWCLTVNY